LIPHLVILPLIVTGFTFARRKRFEIHEKWIFSALILVALSFFAWMAPSHIANFHVVIFEFHPPRVIINMHALFGTIAGILAIYIVLSMKLDFLKDSQ